MSKKYIQSISTFAVALPILGSLLAIMIITLIKSSFIGDFEQKKVVYKQELAQSTVLTQLKKQRSNQKVQLAAWNNLLDGDNYSKVVKHLRTSVKNNNKTKTLQVTAKTRAPRPVFNVDAHRSACEFSLVGTYKELQNNFAELESKMPNLMVNSMSLKPSRNNNLLELKLNYTIWQNQ